MAQNNRDSTAKECQVVKKYLFLKRNWAKTVYNDMSVRLGDKRSSNTTVKNWVTRFRTGHMSKEGEERSRIPTQVTVSGNMDAIHSMILDN
jgi:hypothetical protein